MQFFCLRDGVTKGFQFLQFCHSGSDIGASVLIVAVILPFHSSPCFFNLSCQIIIRAKHIESTPVNITRKIPPNYSNTLRDVGNNHIEK